MPVDARHPDYEDREADWQVMRDCDRGETQVKVREDEYLPIPTGFVGTDFYSQYLLRAQFPEILQPTLDGMVGLIHRVEPNIEMPPAMEPLWERATKDGLPLEAFYRQITREILLMGRYVILADAPIDGAPLPYLCGYKAESLINWDDVNRSIFVLDETRKENDPDTDEFEWGDVEEWRVFRFQDGVYTIQVYNAEKEPEPIITPAGLAGRGLTEIPIVVVGPRDLSLKPEGPPLWGVAKASLAIYRLDADYRHQLFMSGQDTLVVTGVPEGQPSGGDKVGAGVKMVLPIGADAKYVGPAGKGMDAHRQAITDEREAAVAAGARLFDSKKSAESGDALRIRAAAQTATLTTISMASGAALEKSLRNIAMFMGLNPELVTVKPNLSFVDTVLEPAAIAELVRAWQAGAISYETLYENLQRGRIASEERDHEEEKDLIDEEAPDQPLAPGPGGEEDEVTGSGAPGEEEDEVA